MTEIEWSHASTESNIVDVNITRKTLRDYSDIFENIMLYIFAPVYFLLIFFIFSRDSIILTNTDTITIAWFVLNTAVNITLASCIVFIIIFINALLTGEL